MSRTDFFLVVSAETGDTDIDDPTVRADVGQLVTNALETHDNRAPGRPLAGPIETRVIDARQTGKHEPAASDLRCAAGHLCCQSAGEHEHFLPADQCAACAQGWRHGGPSR